MCEHARKPDCIVETHTTHRLGVVRARAQAPGGEQTRYAEMRRSLESLSLNTVCDEAAHAQPARRKERKNTPLRVVALFLEETKKKNSGLEKISSRVVERVPLSLSLSHVDTKERKKMSGSRVFRTRARLAGARTWASAGTAARRPSCCSETRARADAVGAVSVKGTRLFLSLSETRVAFTNCREYSAGRARCDSPSGFCNVKTSQTPAAPDEDEPWHAATAALCRRRVKHAAL